MWNLDKQKTLADLLSETTIPNWRIFMTVYHLTTPKMREGGRSYYSYKWRYGYLGAHSLWLNLHGYLFVYKAGINQHVGKCSARDNATIISNTSLCNNTQTSSLRPLTTQTNQLFTTGSAPNTRRYKRSKAQEIWEAFKYKTRHSLLQPKAIVIFPKKHHRIL